LLLLVLNLLVSFILYTVEDIAPPVAAAVFLKELLPPLENLIYKFLFLVVEGKSFKTSLPRTV
jgi:hypothetical protein